VDVERSDEVEVEKKDEVDAEEKVEVKSEILLLKVVGCSEEFGKEREGMRSKKFQRKEEEEQEC